MSNEALAVVNQAGDDARGDSCCPAHGGQQNGVFGAVSLAGLENLFRGGEGGAEVLFTDVIVDPFFQYPGNLEAVLFIPGSLFCKLDDPGIVGLDIGRRGEVELQRGGGAEGQVAGRILAHGLYPQMPGALFLGGGELVSGCAGVCQANRLLAVPETELVEDLLTFPAEEAPKWDPAREKDLRW